MKKENETLLQNQKREFEEMIGKLNETDRKSKKLQKSKNLTEMEAFKQTIEEQKTVDQFTQYTLPKFYECKANESCLQSDFGFIEKMLAQKIPLLEKKILPDIVSSRRALEAPSVSFVIDAGFPAGANHNCRLYDMAVTEDKKIWLGGHATELKLFDFKGNLHRTVTTTYVGMYICLYNKQAVFSDPQDKAVKQIADDDTLVTMFKTGDWVPFGITGSASGDLLVCLNKDDESKVVRYSSTGTVLQEIQYDSQCQPLYQELFYIAENVNGDIIVTDYEKDKVIAVDRLGIFRYTYSGKDNDLNALSVATDSVGHVYVTDFEGDKIHMPERDGRFLRYIIPEGGIKRPRDVCIFDDGEMIVGECMTGLAKRINFLKD